MGNKKAIANKDKHVYTLVSGEKISTGWLNEHEKRWLKELQEDAEKGDDYFMLLRAVRGLGARPLRGAPRLTHKIAQSAFFRIAEDIVERAGIRQGVSLPPDPELGSMDGRKLVSAPEAAEIIGLTRAALHRALVDGRIRGWKVGAMWVLSRADVLKYHKKRQESIMSAV